MNAEMRLFSPLGPRMEQLETRLFANRAFRTVMDAMTGLNLEPDRQIWNVGHGGFAHVGIPYCPGHCKLTLPRRGREINDWTLTTGPLQGHFTPQGTTNPRLDPYYRATASSLYTAGADKSTSGPLALGHCKLTLPCRGRQIHVWTLTTKPLQAHFKKMTTLPNLDNLDNPDYPDYPN